MPPAGHTSSATSADCKRYAGTGPRRSHAAGRGKYVRRQAWGLGEAFTQRDAAARTFEHLLSRDTPRDPQDWATPTAREVPEWTLDLGVVGRALSGLGKAAAPALLDRARELGIPLPAELDEPGGELPPRLLIPVLRQISVHFFPLLGTARDREPYPTS